MSDKDSKKEMVLDTDGNRNRSNETETGDEFLKKMQKALEETRKDSGSVFYTSSESTRFVSFSPSNERKLLIDQETFNSQMKKLSFLMKKSSIDNSFNNESKQCSSASPLGFFSYSSSDESSGEENEPYTEDSESEYEFNSFARKLSRSARIAPIYPAPDRPPGILTTAFQSDEGTSSPSPDDAVRRQQSCIPRNVVIPPLLVSETLNNLHERNNVSESPPPAYDRLPQLQLSTDNSPPSDSGPVEVPPLDTIKSRLENHLLMLDYSKKNNQPGSEGFDQMLEIYKEIILTILYMEEGMTPQEEVYNLEIATHFVYDRLNDLEESEENKLILTVYKVMNQYLKENKGTVAFNMLVLELLHLEKIIRQKSKEEYAEIERNLFSDIALC